MKTKTRTGSETRESLTVAGVVVPERGARLTLAVDQNLIDKVKEWASMAEDGNGPNSKWARQLEKLREQHGDFRVPVRFLEAALTSADAQATLPDGRVLIHYPSEVNYLVVSEQMVIMHGEALLEEPKEARKRAFLVGEMQPAQLSGTPIPLELFAEHQLLSAEVEVPSQEEDYFERRRMDSWSAEGAPEIPLDERDLPILAL